MANIGLGKGNEKVVKRQGISKQNDKRPSGLFC